ncbi:MAG: hypothetical protein D6687_02020 [Acidobacteria bacterium]|jgi:hypothetical protein|nr:MAG: hypothetical protein D6687_02020 [Acidobacteriota bacterium]GIU81854.1 MAG: hypothetical protein KatS3mg006_0918 [Pyrinomonadaceae bacterium]
MKIFLFTFCLSLLVFLSFSSSCNLKAEEIKSESVASGEKFLDFLPDSKTNAKPKTIQISPGSPAETVRKFYKNLRERRFREALMMTNLKPAIEAMTDEELSDFQTDFESAALEVPEEIQISGEIINGNRATVTVKVLNEITNTLEDKAIQLRRDNDLWIILWLDESAEASLKREGKNYLYQLRIEAYQTQTQELLQRIVRAQTIYALQNEGQFADLRTLIQQGLLPEELQDPKMTGYKYKIVLASNKRSYYITAEPLVYNKTGKLSFLVEVESLEKEAKLKSKDNKGRPLKE